MVESEGSYVRIHVGERSYLHRASIRALEEQLQPDEFVRIHRARLVRVGAIQEVRRTKLGTPQILLSGGRVLHAGRVYAKALRRRLAAAA
jgi:two-component system LytT family response regulator